MYSVFTAKAGKKIEADAIEAAFADQKMKVEELTSELQLRPERALALKVEAKAVG